jgi:polar amino acid transport system substrate-binding protein
MQIFQWRRCVAGVFIAACGNAFAAPNVTICAEPDPPPWTYWVQDTQGKPTDVFVGASVDIVRSAFERIGLKVEFKGEYPWARCLKMVEGGEVDFAMDGYYDVDRAKRFAYSRHYNTLTPQILYRPDKPIVIKSLDALRAHKGCGMRGASYEHYNLRTDELDLGESYPLMIDKLKAGRCDYFVEELEVIAGYKLSGSDYLADSGVKRGPVPGSKAPAKHLLTAINGPHAAIIPKLNKALGEVVKSGEAAKAWKKHAGNLLQYKP